MRTHTFYYTEEDTSSRLDIFITKHLDQYSRSNIQQFIADGTVSVNQQIITSKKHQLTIGDEVDICCPDKVVTHDAPEDIPINKAYEDEHLVIIIKPRGLVVHPGAGCPKNTLLNALIYHYPSNSSLPQAGMIHRLDKDTTGLLIVAKTLDAYNKLNQQMLNREIKRKYLALVKGVIHQSGTINEPLARHHKVRQKYTVHPSGKDAVTHYSVKQRFKHHTLLKVELETGRTHQIRVHLHHIGHSIVGDQTYNRGHSYKQGELSQAAASAIHHFKYQALHAFQLELQHPISGELLKLENPLPQDFSNLISLLN